MSIKQNYEKILRSIPKEVRLVAVSKTYPPEDILRIYQEGHRDFGENRVQELLLKIPELPSDIQWHLIGHLQTNKVKQVLPHIALIQSVDRLKLIQKIQSEAHNLNKEVSILLQLKIAEEESKYGMSEEELDVILKRFEQGEYPNIKIKGLMGMASFTKNPIQINKEFQLLNKIYQKHKKKYSWNTLSMGMSGDYQWAIEQGSNLIRVGSLIFGKRG